MKDIGNYKLLQVHEALQRLDRAVSHLEAASNTLAPALSLAREAPALKSRLEEITTQHAALKTSAEDVAIRLDQAIARLASVIGSDSGSS